ncbi:MAG: aminodeoxychorismate/anthranilate synthase component II [Bacteroidales bacterium]
MKVLIIDNYDSFTYNLSHLLKELGAEVTVVRNDVVDLDSIENFDKIVLSPGPGIPSEAGKLLEVIERFAPTKSILGVCLGMQAIGEVFGGELENLSEVYHGIASEIDIIADDSIYNGIDKSITVGRYHSWVVADNNFPESLIVTARGKGTNDIMSVRHREYDVTGVQYHPESVLTPMGKEIINNWLNK